MKIMYMMNDSESDNEEDNENDVITMDRRAMILKFLGSFKDYL
jgi:hypothetical protein